MNSNTINVASLSVASARAEAIEFEDYDYERFNWWRARREESGAVVEERSEADCDDPNLRFFWPIERMPDPDPEVAARVLAELPLVLVDRGGAMGLSLTASGSDLSWELAAGYVLMGMVPPLVIAEGLPKLAGRRWSEMDRVVMAACQRTIEYSRGRADRAAVLVEELSFVAKPSFSIKPTRLVMTPGARDGVHPDDMLAAVARHFAGDWGELSDDDRRANELAVVGGERVFSAYHDRQRVKFYVITEADRSSTCVLLPDEY
jgi:hypothetical protein